MLHFLIVGGNTFSSFLTMTIKYLKDTITVVTVVVHPHATASALSPTHKWFGFWWEGGEPTVLNRSCKDAAYTHAPGTTHCNTVRFRNNS